MAVFPARLALPVCKAPQALKVPPVIPAHRGRRVPPDRWEHKGRKARLDRKDRRVWLGRKVLRGLLARLDHRENPAPKARKAPPEHNTFTVG